MSNVEGDLARTIEAVNSRQPEVLHEPGETPPPVETGDEDSSQIAGENLESATKLWDESIEAPDPGAEPAESEVGAVSTEIGDADLQRAVESGMSVTEAREFGTPQALQTAVLALQRQRQQFQAYAQQQQQQAPQQQAEAPLFEPFKLDLEDVHLDEGARSQIEKMNEYYSSQGKQVAQQNQALANEVMQLKHHLANQHASQAQTEFDQLLTQHGSDYAEYLGEGPSPQLPKDSPFWQEREKVSRAMNLAFQMANGQISHEEAFLSGLNTVFADRSAKIQREKLRQDIRKQTTGKVAAKPNSRPTKGVQDGAKRTANRWDSYIRG